MANAVRIPNAMTSLPNPVGKMASNTTARGANQMPDIMFPNREALPEELRQFAKDAEGGVVINLVPNERLQEFRENNIKVSKERDAFKATVDSVNTLFPEFDPSKVTAELHELRSTFQQVKDGKLTASTDIEAATIERTKSMKQQFEEQRAALTTSEKAARDRAAMLDTRLRQQAIKQAVLGAVLDEKSGVAPSAVEDIISRAQNVFVVENDGERVIPKIGDTTLYGQDGTTPMSPSEWVQTLKEKSPHLFRSSTGGAGAGQQNTGKFGGFSQEQFDKMLPEEKIRIANEAVRPRGM